MELYTKIKNDIRHNKIKLELSNDVVKRNFPDWSMGFFDADESEKYNIPGFSRFLETGFEISPLHNDNNNNNTLNLLLDFKRLANLQNCA